MAQIRAIDVDGHVLERQSDIRKYLDEPYSLLGQRVSGKSKASARPQAIVGRGKTKNPL